MASPIPDIGPLRAPQGMHLALAVGVPAVFANLALFWVSGSVPLWPEAVFALVYTVVLGFWAPWRQRSRQGPLLKLWVWLVATLLLYGAFSLVDGRPWPRTFNFEGRHLLWFLPAFLQGQLTALWAGQLTSRARLYQLIEGVPAGRALEERVHDFQLDADFSRSNEATLSGSLVVLCFLALAGATFSPYGRGGLSFMLAGGFVVLCLFVGVLLRVYRREMEALVYGHRFTLAEKLAPLGWSALLLALAGLGAWGLTASGGPWVDWDQLLRSHREPLAAPEPADVPVEPPDAFHGARDYSLAVLFALLQLIFRVQNILAVVEFVLRSAWWLAPWAFAAFVLWPLVKWLADGGRETKGFLKLWRRLLAEQWKMFLDAIRSWFRRPTSISEGPFTEAVRAREWLAGLFRRPGPARRAPYPEVVEAFLRLARWAEPLTTYHPGETTHEYLDRLMLLVPGQESALAEVRDLLDRELFSPRGLDPDGRRAFLSLVADLLAVPPSHETP